MPDMQSTRVRWVEEDAKCSDRLTSPFLRYSAVLVAGWSQFASHHNRTRHHKTM